MLDGLRATTIALGLLLAAVPTCAQPIPPPAKPAEEELQNDSDPTKSVFLSVRNEYFNLSDDAWINVLVIRSDRVLLRKHRRLGGKLGILTRFDLPVVTAHFDGTTQTGLGDLYAQALYVPWLTPGFALAMGSGMAFPTATARSLGMGKWRVAPLVAPVWFFPERKGYFLVRLHQFVSFAGPSDRRDTNYLLTAPTLLYRFHPRWWIVLDTEMKTDWEQDNHASFRSGLQIGYFVTPLFAIAIKPEVPWGGHREAAPSIPGNWALKLTITRHRRRN